MNIDTQCRYCTHLGWPKQEGTSWESVDWFCASSGTYSDGPHQCELFKREPGADDDLGDEASE
jgi:hypothetical protein